AAELRDRLVVLGLRLGRKRRDVRLAEAGEDRANAVFVRPAGDAAHVVLGDRPERNPMARQHAVPGYAAAGARVPERAVQVEHDWVDHERSSLTGVIRGA